MTAKNKNKNTNFPGFHVLTVIRGHYDTSSERVQNLLIKANVRMMQKQASMIFLPPKSSSEEI